MVLTLAVTESTWGDAGVVFECERVCVYTLRWGEGWTVRKPGSYDIKP